MENSSPPVRRRDDLDTSETKNKSNYKLKSSIMRTFMLTVLKELIISAGQKKSIHGIAGISGELINSVQLHGDFGTWKVVLAFAPSVGTKVDVFCKGVVPRTTAYYNHK